MSKVTETYWGLGKIEKNSLRSYHNLGIYVAI